MLIHRLCSPCRGADGEHPQGGSVGWLVGWRALVVAAVLGAVPGTRAEGLLGLEQAVHLAQQRSRQWVAQDWVAIAAREQAVAAGQLPDPTLKTGIDNLPLNGEDRFSLVNDSMTMRTLGVMQEFTRSDKRRARSARFGQEAALAEATRAVLLAELQRATATAWLERHYLERMHAQLVVLRDEATLQVEAADAAYRGGLGTQAEVLAARLGVVQVQDRMQQTAQQLDAARTRLARWVGDAASQGLAQAPDLTRLRWDSGMLEQHMARHPPYALMRAQEALAQADADLAQSEKQPDWSLEVMLQQRGPAYSNMLSVRASLPLRWAPQDRQDRVLAAKQAVVEQLRAQREEALRDALAEIRNALQQWQGTRARLALYDSAQVPLARERTNAALAAYRGAKAPLAAVLEARRAELDTGLARLQLELESAQWWARLEYLMPAPADADAAAFHPTAPEQQP